MTRLAIALARIVADLHSARRRFALVGGVAISVRAAPRFTRDLDLAVAVGDDREAEALVREMFARGYRLLAQVEQESTGRLATVRFVAPGSDAGGMVVDLLFASSGIEEEVVRDAEPVEIVPGVVVPVARREHLIAMKVLARDDRRRPQDHDDLKELLVRADAAELDRAELAVELIERRGFARGKDLVSELRTLIAEHPRGV